MPGLDQRGVALPPELALPSGNTVVVYHNRHSFVSARRYSMVFECAGGVGDTTPMFFARPCGGLLHEGARQTRSDTCRHPLWSQNARAA